MVGEVKFCHRRVPRNCSKLKLGFGSIFSIWSNIRNIYPMIYLGDKLMIMSRQCQALIYIHDVCCLSGQAGQMLAKNECACVVVTNNLLVRVPKFHLFLDCE